MKNGAVLFDNPLFRLPWRQQVAPKHRWLFTNRHGVVSRGPQFINTSLRTSNFAPFSVVFWRFDVYRRCISWGDTNKNTCDLLSSLKTVGQKELMNFPAGVRPTHVLPTYCAVFTVAWHIWCACRVKESILTLRGMKNEGGKVVKLRVLH